MRRVLRHLLVAFTLLLLSGGTALACHLEGRIVCDPLGLPIAGATVVVTGGTLAEPAIGQTDSEGYYTVWLPDVLPATYLATVQVSQGTVVEGPQSFTVAEPTGAASVSWTVTGAPGCEALGCWLTGGGAKFSTVAGINVAERGPKVNFGGNVNPSCSPLPGDGGQWTHVDHSLKLHFQGRHVVVDRCGNVSGIPPGSTSPVTPYNFIEFSGTGRLSGISGNPVAYDLVCFSARAEDRNEPGSSGVRDGARKDRYFLRVYDCAAPAVTLLVLEATPGASDPVVITDGNLQLHISSCAVP